MVIDDKTILTEEKYDYYFDLVVIDENGNYINPSEIILMPNGQIKISFDIHYEKLKIYLYRLAENEHEIYQYNIMDSNILDDELTIGQYIENDLSSLDVIPIIYNSNGKRYNIQYDITPRYISLESGIIKSKQEIQNNLYDLQDKIIDVIKLSGNIPSSVIYQENEIFKNLIDTYYSLLELNDTLSSDFLISKSFMYNSKNAELIYLRFGQDSFNVKWNTSNNSVCINHNLNGHVKFTIDYVSDNGVHTLLNSMKYSAIEKSTNELEIHFNTNIMTEYCLMLFKI